MSNCFEHTAAIGMHIWQRQMVPKETSFHNVERGQFGNRQPLATGHNLPNRCDIICLTHSRPPDRAVRPLDVATRLIPLPGDSFYHLPTASTDRVLPDS